MPNLGDIKEAKELGFRGTNKSVWHACVDCGKERWVKLYYGQARNPRCSPCSAKVNNQRGENNPNWRGGRCKREGYVLISTSLGNPFFPMAKAGGRDNCKYVLEHRLVMAQHLGRCLTSREVIHHLNGIKDDNRMENLALTTAKGHPTKSFIKQLQGRIRELEQLHLGI